MRLGEHLRAQPPKKRVQAMRRGQHLRASTTAKEAGARNAAGRASASTTTEEAGASNALGMQKKPVHAIPWACREEVCEKRRFRATAKEAIRGQSNSYVF